MNILLTGANGFIGLRVAKQLLEKGFSNITCFIRSENNVNILREYSKNYKSTTIKIIKGNLLSRQDCLKATKNIDIIYQLAAGIEKTFPGSYLNSVVTTRNLIEAALSEGILKKFVNVSSMAVYSNFKLKRHAQINESSPIENHHNERYEAYCYSKIKQDELVVRYGKSHSLPYIIVRPGVVFGPGKTGISPRIGIDTFGIFMNLGAMNYIPFTYVDNCAEAIVKAGIAFNLKNYIFNIVDDHMIKGNEFLSLYKKRVCEFNSIRVPYVIFYGFCSLWEKYSHYSKNQLPPVFNRRKCAYLWKGNTFENSLIKKQLCWVPKIDLYDGLEKYFRYEKKYAF